ncbi:Hypothetical Protein RradSPS_1591 [Rubrobacter radiotolerans]|uniref:Uncharacterized protein n=1 Tax=Rubrobacter radiotolerans TaxID=42256 RepID=A0A023X489_RUBRA|nr:Hypothetical Protein RradSPS_1591 [Rubrobacter radiotolerans]SMC05636.1 hypothetical protein SAMN00767673_1591 [Rubrobacter radiotolerans DSM 5868]
MPEARLRVLERGTVLMVMCGWSLALLAPVGWWLDCEAVGTSGFTPLCASLYPPTVYPWIGVVVIVVGTLMQAAIGRGIKEFAALAFQALCGGICIGVLAFMAQSLSVPWAIAGVMLAIAVPVLAYYWRGGRRIGLGAGGSRAGGPE